MESCREYRKRAKVALDGKIFSNSWLMAIVAIFIVGAITSALSFTFIGTLLVTGPFAFGMAMFYINAVRNSENKNDLGTLFKGFSTDFGGNFLLGFLRGIFEFLWSLLLIIPGIIKHYAYAMSFYIKVDNPDYDWKQCLDESKKMMKGKKMKLFLLNLSFIGWYIVGALCLGIGTFWVGAYNSAAVACFYEDAKAACVE